MALQDRIMIMVMAALFLAIWDKLAKFLDYFFLAFYIFLLSLAIGWYHSPLEHVGVFVVVLHLLGHLSVLLDWLVGVLGEDAGWSVCLYVSSVKGLALPWDELKEILLVSLSWGGTSTSGWFRPLFYILVLKLYVVVTTKVLRYRWLES